VHYILIALLMVSKPGALPSAAVVAVAASLGVAAGLART
jgi:hypothetical protein